MLKLSEKQVNIFKQALKYTEENYTPVRDRIYSDKFDLLEGEKTIDDELFFAHEYIDFRKKVIDVPSKKPENKFCEYLIDYFGGDTKVLKEYWKRARMSDTAVEGVLSRTFSPSKACAVSIIIALELDFDKATELLEAAGIEWSKCNKFDVVTEFFIKNAIYDFPTINAILYLLDLPMIKL